MGHSLPDTLPSMTEHAPAAAPDPADREWEGASPPGHPSGLRAPAGPLALFALVVFANAALLFTVEPLFGKLVLPLLGGTSAVWSTCMMFYQGVLLGGYLYAHFGGRLLGGRAFAGVHLALFALACVTLPIQVAVGWTPPTTGTPVPWLLGLLGVSLGLPFFVLSAGAPLLQRWYADTAPQGADPYVLYAASNAGSLMALLAYPALLEPLATLRAQSLGWSVAFVLLALLFGACALRLWRASGSVGGVLNDPGSAVVAPTTVRGQRPRWLLLSAIPSSLLLGTTSYLTTDIAPVPLLWVVPLALYLITFIVAYGAGARRVPDWLPRAARLLLIPTVLVTVLEVRVPIGPTLAWTLATFVAVALVCHLRLAAERPAPAHLTEYYAWISLGGLLGSAFNVLVAPGLFDAAYEYPLALVAALVLMATSGRRAATPEVLDRSARATSGWVRPPWPDSESWSGQSRSGGVDEHAAAAHPPPDRRRRAAGQCGAAAPRGHGRSRPSRTARHARRRPEWARSRAARPQLLRGVSGHPDLGRRCVPPTDARQHASRPAAPRADRTAPPPVVLCPVGPRG
jgi:hypothetical protein